MRIVVKCSTGTYVRTLAEDIGKALGCGGAYLTALRRSILDNFDLSQAYTLDALEAMPTGATRLPVCIRPIVFCMTSRRYGGRCGSGIFTARAEWCGSYFSPDCLNNSAG